MSEEDYDGPKDEFGMPLLADDEPDDDTQAPAQDWTLPKLARLEWRGRGDTECWCEFRDPEDLSQSDLRAIRRAGGNAGTNRGEMQNQLLNAGLIKLIENWEIGYRVNLPIPSAASAPTAILDQLSAIDGRRLERHIEPTLDALIRGSGTGAEGTGKGSPRTPERG